MFELESRPVSVNPWLSLLKQIGNRFRAVSPHGRRKIRRAGHSAGVERLEERTLLAAAITQIIDDTNNASDFITSDTTLQIAGTGQAGGVVHLTRIFNGVEYDVGPGNGPGPGLYNVTPFGQWITGTIDFYQTTPRNPVDPNDPTNLIIEPAISANTLDMQYQLKASDVTGASTKIITIRPNAMPQVAPWPTGAAQSGAAGVLSVSSGVPLPTPFATQGFSGTWGSNQTLYFTVTFDTNVLTTIPSSNLADRPYLQLNAGPNARAYLPDPASPQASLASGNGTNQLNFYYRVGFGDNAASLNASQLVVPTAARIETVSGVTGVQVMQLNPVQPSFPAPANPPQTVTPTVQGGTPLDLGSLPSTNQLSASFIGVDATRNGVIDVFTPQSVADGTYGLGQSFEVDILLNAAATVTGPRLPILIMDTLAVRGTAVYIGPVNTLVNPLRFQYTVGPGENTVDLDVLTFIPNDTTSSIGTFTTVVPRGSYTSNEIISYTGFAPFGSLANNRQIVIDTPPIVMNADGKPSDDLTAPGGHVHTTGEIIDLTLLWSELVNVTPDPGGSPFFFVNTQPNNARANYFNGSAVPLPSRTTTFRYIVGTTGENTFDLDAASGIQLGGVARITDTDLLPNNAVLAMPSQGGQLGAGNNPFANAANSIGGQRVIQVDTDAPRIDITNGPGVTATEANGTYAQGAQIHIVVSFTEAIFVDTTGGSPTLALATGPNPALATFVGGSGTNTLTFLYTVRPGDKSPDLDYIANGLKLNGATIKDRSGINADLSTLPAPAAVGSLSWNKNLVIDTIPAVINITSPSPNGFYKAGTQVQISLQFNKAVEVQGNPQLKIRTGPSSFRLLDFTNGGTGSGTDTLTWVYTVQPGDNTPDLDLFDVNSVLLNGGSIVAFPGGAPANLTLPTPGAPTSLGFNKDIVIDTTPPAILSLNSPNADATYRTGQTLSLTVQFTEPVKVFGTPQLTLETNLIPGIQTGIGGDRVINWSGAGSNSNTLTFNYTIQPGENSPDLDALSPMLLTGGARITDLADQDILLTGLAVPFGPGNPNSLGAQKSLVIDGTPVVVNVTVNPTYADAIVSSGSANPVIPIWVTFSETVNVTGTLPRLFLETNGIAGIGTGQGRDAVVNFSGLRTNIYHTPGVADLLKVGTPAERGGLVTVTRTANSIGVQQVDDATVQGTITAGVQFRLPINGTVYTYTAVAGDNAAAVAAGLRNVINSANLGNGDPNVTVGGAGAVVQLTAKVAGTPFTVGNNTLIFNYQVGSDGGFTWSGPGVATAAQSETVTIVDPTFLGVAGRVVPGTVYALPLGGATYTYTAVAGNTTANVATALATAINADAASLADAATAGAVITLTRRAPASTAFVVGLSNDGSTSIPGTSFGQTSIDLEYASTLSLAVVGAGTIRDADFTIDDATLVLPAPVPALSANFVPPPVVLLPTVLNGSIAFNRNIQIDSIVNDAPVMVVPLTAQSTNEEVNLVFSTANGNAIQLADVDHAGGDETVTVSVTNGTLGFVPSGLTSSSGSGTSSISLTGTVSNINTTLGNGLTFIPTTDFPFAATSGTAVLTVNANDNGNSDPGPVLGTPRVAVTKTVNITVNAINDAPVNSVPGAQVIDEDTDLVFSVANGNLISISDVDAGTTSLVKVTLTATNGTVTLGSIPAGVTVVGGADGTATVTVTGTVPNLNTALAGTKYRSTLNYPGTVASPTALSGPASVTILTEDLGNTGTGGSLSDSDTVSITVNAVNDAPVNGVPAAQGTNVDSPVVFSAANGTAIVISDVDAGANIVQVTLQVGPGATDGTLTLAGTTGLNFTFADVNGVGTGPASATNSPTMTFRGTLADINAALNGLSYTPPSGRTGAFSVTITTNDLGSTGTPGPRSTTTSVAVNVDAFNDPPVNIVPGAQITPEDTAVVFSTANGNRIAVSDPDAGANAIQVTLTAANGTVTLNGAANLSFTFSDSNGTGSSNPANLTFRGKIVDINNALNGMSFTPSANYNGSAASLTITTNDRGFTGNEIPPVPKTDTDTVLITVTPVNDAPVNGFNNQQFPAVNPSVTTNEDTPLVFNAANGNKLSIADVDAGNAMIQVTLAATNGTLTLGSTVALLFTFSDGNGTGTGTGTNDATMTFRGTLASINNAVGTLTFIPARDYPGTLAPTGPASITIVTNDLGNSLGPSQPNQTGPVLTATNTVDIVVVAVNDPPVVTVPASPQTTLEDTLLTFSSATNNAISVADVDTGAVAVQVTLTAVNGTISLNGTTGLSFSFSDVNGTSTGTGTNDTVMRFRGNLTSINNALNGLSFRPGANLNSPATPFSLTVLANDLGNAGIGGALTDTKTVTINVTPVNDAPTLTRISTLASATVQVPFTITYAMLQQAGDQNDVDGDVMTYIIQQVLTGTLTKNGQPVVAGTTTIAAGDSVVWTPPIGVRGTTAAFSVIVTDNAQPTPAFSSPAVRVNVDVVNSAPTLTRVNTFLGGQEDILYSITYNSLIANSDASDINGDTIQFRIESVSSGTLTKNGVAVTTGVNATLVGPGDTLAWQGDQDANGTLPAFKVTAYDGSLVSSTPVQVSVALSPVNDAPTLTNINLLPGTQVNVPLTITHATLLSASNAVDVDGDPILFRIRGINTGTLTKITISGSTMAIVTGPSGTTIGPGESLVWTAQAGTPPGVTPAFTVTATDGQLDSAQGNIQVRIDVINTPPTLTTITTLGTATEDTPFNISYVALAAAADEADVNGTTLSFRVEAVSSGTLTQSGVPVVPGTTLLSSGGPDLVWTPAANANNVTNGNAALPAFTVTAFDGLAASASPVSVRVNVNAVNDAPTLTAVTTLANGHKNLPFAIDYATLLAASNANDVEGDAITFRIQGVAAGTTLTKNSVPVVAGTTTLGIGESLVWNPVHNATGAAVNAFTIVAFDPSNAFSTPDVQVTVNVVNDLPTLSTINTLQGATEDTAFPISFATLFAASNLADVNNEDALHFRLVAIQSGILLQGGNPVTAGASLLDAGSPDFVWTPASNANGTLPAFTVVGYDGTAASTTPVQVNVNVGAVNDAPTLSTISTLSTAVGFQPFNIPYATLLAASNAFDIDGDAISFRVAAISSGTLTRNGQPVTVGTTTLSAGQALIWTSPASTFGTLNAFTVVAIDPSSAVSTPAVQVKVNTINTAPTLTTVSTLPGGVEDQPFVISYNTLKSASDANDPNGDPLSFSIEGISNGTLTKNGLPVTPGATLVSAGDTLIWTPPLYTKGVLQAFTVKVSDGSLSSSTAVPVTVNVVHVNHAPTLTTINSLTGAIGFQPFTIAFSTLQQASNIFDVDGDLLSFRVEAVSSGTLTRNGVPVLPGTTLLSPNESLVWTSPRSTFGVLPAFTVRAFDGQAASTSPVQVRVSTANTAPTLTTIATLQGATEDTAFSIPYATLTATSDVKDLNGDTISFVIDAVTSGTLTKNGSPVLAGTTRLNTGETLVWTPAANANGTLPAFTMRAFDAQLSSSPPLQVNVAVASVNDAPTMTTIGTIGFVVADAPTTITYQQIAGNSDASDVDGDPLSFRIDLVVTGSLTKNGVPVVNGQTTLSAGESLAWTPSSGTHGLTSAFTVSATDGQAFSASQIVNLNVEAVRMYRAYNPNAAYHFFTTSYFEFANAVAHGYRDETTGNAGFAILDTPEPNTEALHRLRNPNTGKHYYTHDTNERNFLVSRGWVFEKDEGFILVAQIANSTEIYKLYNRNSGTHLYTDSAATRDAILNQFPGIWIPNTSLGFGFSLPPATVAPPPGGGGSGSGGTQRATAAPVIASATATGATVSTSDAVSLQGVDSGLAASAPADSAPAVSTETAAPTQLDSDDSLSSDHETLDQFWNSLGQGLTTGADLSEILS